MTRLLGSLSKGLLFVVSAPAGTGKTTLVRMLTEEFSCIEESISYTTRLIRPKEKEGKDYHFISDREFDEMVQRDEFLEHAQVFGHRYGTSKRLVEAARKKGRHVVLVIDTQGALEIKAKTDAVCIFIAPPSLNELKTRLISRGTDSEAAITKRLSWAEHEISLAPYYDYKIINDNLSTAYQVLRSILIAEEHKISSVC